MAQQLKKIWNDILYLLEKLGIVEIWWEFDLDEVMHDEKI